MLRDLQVTLYDIFGYLLPGFVALAALAGLFWAIAAPNRALAAPDWSSPIWLAVIVSAYLLGHLLQAVGNFLAAATRTTDAGLASSVLADIPAKLRKEVEDLSHTDDAATVLRLCDAGVLQKGNVAEREIFVYREGFYRGMVGAFLFASTAVIVRWARDGASYVDSGRTLPVPPEAFAFLLGVCCLAVVLSFARYLRFARYRVSAAIWGFLAMVVAARVLGSDKEDT